jgi:hypothetical protein
LAARIIAALYRALIALSAALVCGALIGFRFYGSWWDTVGFLGFALLIALALCLGADLLGSISRSPEATTQVLILPQLILGMVSTGFTPAQQFPSWIQGSRATSRCRDSSCGCGRQPVIRRPTRARWAGRCSVPRWPGRSVWPWCSAVRARSSPCEGRHDADADARAGYRRCPAALRPAGCWCRRR